MNGAAISGDDADVHHRAAGECDVLVVDDDADCRDVLTELLQWAGYHPRAVVSGTEALEAMSAMRDVPRLVLLDIVMPGLTGFDVIRAMRATPRLAAIPVVVHTGVTWPAESTERLTIAQWLNKPVRVEELLDVTRRFVS